MKSIAEKFENASDLMGAVTGFLMQLFCNLCITGLIVLLLFFLLAQLWRILV